VKFDFGDFLQNLLREYEFVKIVNNIGHFTWAPKVRFIVAGDINRP